LSCDNQIVTSSSVTDSKENIASRRFVVYKTLIDPAVARIAGEKNKHKLFSKFLFRLTSPEEIEFVSTEKYYEPFMTVSGKYLIDYYRKCAYTVRINEKVTEVILFDKSFVPKQASNLPPSPRSIKLEGEERLTINMNAFLFLSLNAQELKIKDFPSAPSEENPQELIQSLNMPAVAPNIDVETIRKKIAQRPTDISRIVTEQFEIDQRSVIYRPIYRVTYKCPKLGKEASLEFDGITSKMVNRKENFIIAAARTAINELKQAFMV
jgi:hypothetical protein